MRLTLILLTITTWTSALGQLRSTYTLKGVADETAGRVRFKSQIVLRDDNSFLWISEKYNYNDNTLISADSSIGTWTTDNKILKLDHTPTTTSPNEDYDTYLIKNRKLKRTTIKGKWTIYKATGDIVKVTDKRLGTYRPAHNSMFLQWCRDELV